MNFAPSLHRFVRSPYNNSSKDRIQTPSTRPTFSIIFDNAIEYDGCFVLYVPHQTWGFAPSMGFSVHCTMCWCNQFFRLHTLWNKLFTWSWKINNFTHSTQHPSLDQPVTPCKPCNLRAPHCTSNTNSAGLHRKTRNCCCRASAPRPRAPYHHAAYYPTWLGILVGLNHKELFSFGQTEMRSQAMGSRDRPNQPRVQGQIPTHVKQPMQSCYNWNQLTLL